ncbi:MAG: energy-coupled thiamine transporter ThiT [Oscillospiraceae bacterium]|jgi:thiamine transporter
MERIKLRALVEGAVFIALAQTLGYLKLFELPQGGSVTLSLLPFFMYCARWGVGPGLLAGFAFGVLQLVFDGAYAWSWQSMLGDYIVAFSVLGLSGAFCRKRGGFFIGTAVGCTAKFLAHWVTGATVWAEYMPEEFFGLTMTSPWFYSALYNGSFMLADMIIALLLGALIWKPLGRFIRGEDIGV